MSIIITDDTYSFKTFLGTVRVKLPLNAEGELYYDERFNSAYDIPQAEILEGEPFLDKLYCHFGIFVMKNKEGEYWARIYLHDFSDGYPEYLLTKD